MSGSGGAGSGPGGDGGTGPGRLLATHLSGRSILMRTQPSPGGGDSRPQPPDSMPVPTRPGKAYALRAVGTGLVLGSTAGVALLGWVMSR